MPHELNQQALHNAYLNLPNHIREWLASEQIVYLISEINGRLGFRGEKLAVVPELIFRLIVQDLEPIDFINELSHDLNISFQTAKSIAEDIEKKVLKPVESELRRDVGIDLKLIYFGKPSAQRAEPKLQETLPAPAPIPPISPIAPAPLPSPPASPPAPLQATGPTEWEKWHAKSAPSPTAPEMFTPPTGQARPYEPKETKTAKPAEPVVDLESFQIKGGAPFILHQEGYAVPQKTPKAEPILNIKATPALPPKESGRPISVQIETPSPPAGGSGQAPPIRVVHYNGMRTPLNSLGMPKEIPPQNRIDLRKLK